MCFRNLELASPSDIVQESAIQIIDSNVVLDLSSLNIPFTKPPRVWISPIPDTGSMDPVFDHGHNNIYIQGIDEQNQRILILWLSDEWFNKQMANIIVFLLPGENPIVHRLHDIKIDGQGRQWWFKGDNNKSKDPIPARDEHIKWLLLGTIY